MNSIMDNKKLDRGLEFVMDRIDSNIKTYRSYVFPGSQTRNYHYPLYPNYEWTPGFWTGMIWLAYELTGDNKYRDVALGQMQSYRQRMVDKV